MKQTDQILAHLRSSERGKYLTLSPMEALGLYRIQRLAARVNDLKRQGYAITREMRQDRTGKWYARYSLDHAGSFAFGRRT